MQGCLRAGAVCKHLGAETFEGAGAVDQRLFGPEGDKKISLPSDILSELCFAHQSALLY